MLFQKGPVPRWQKWSSEIIYIPKCRTQEPKENDNKHSQPLLIKYIHIPIIWQYKDLLFTFICCWYCIIVLVNRNFYYPPEGVSSLSHNYSLLESGCRQAIYPFSTQLDFSTFFQLLHCALATRFQLPNVYSCVFAFNLTLPCICLVRCFFILDLAVTLHWYKLYLLVGSLIFLLLFLSFSLWIQFIFCNHYRELTCNFQ